ncbi:hypothetical protein [Pseudoroseicyclus sp. CXY001]|uniref:hypothetical protein n=1 Tax=Pseudoroseicyclus sp. CXY001 TaxID=3242492 RepID=UPI0035712DC4
MARMTRVNSFTAPPDYRDRLIAHLMRIRDTLCDCRSAFNVRLLAAADGEIVLIYEHVGRAGAAECASFLDSRHAPEDRHAALLALKAQMSVRSYHPVEEVAPAIVPKER